MAIYIADLIGVKKTMWDIYKTDWSVAMSKVKKPK